MEYKMARFERIRNIPHDQIKTNKSHPFSTMQGALFADSFETDQPAVAMTSPKRFPHKREQRYYVIRLEQDLLGDWRILRVNGQIGHKLGQVRYDILANREQAEQRFHVLCQRRMKTKHYQLTQSKHYVLTVNNDKGG